MPGCRESIALVRLLGSARAAREVGRRRTRLRDHVEVAVAARRVGADREDGAGPHRQALFRTPPAPPPRRCRGSPFHATSDAALSQQRRRQLRDGGQGADRSRRHRVIGLPPAVGRLPRRPLLRSSVNGSRIRDPGRGRGLVDEGRLPARRTRSDRPAHQAMRRRGRGPETRRPRRDRRSSPPPRARGPRGPPASRQRARPTPSPGRAPSVSERGSAARSSRTRSSDRRAAGSSADSDEVNRRPEGRPRRSARAPCPR